MAQAYADSIEAEFSAEFGEGIVIEVHEYKSVISHRFYIEATGRRIDYWELEDFKPVGRSTSKRRIITSQGLFSYAQIRELTAPIFNEFKEYGTYF